MMEIEAQRTIRTQTHASRGVVCGCAAMESMVMNAFAPAVAGQIERAEGCPEWYAIWTRSHSEQLVADQLTAKGLDIFLPKLTVWSRRGGVRHAIRVPMFSGYLFVRAHVDKNIYLDVIKARGVVRILGDAWDCLSPVSSREMEALQQLVSSGLAVTPHSYLEEGQHVRVTAGPLKGVEGILVENRSEKGILVISVELLRRSVAVQIDCTWVAAA